MFFFSVFFFLSLFIFVMFVIVISFRLPVMTGRGYARLAIIA